METFDFDFIIKETNEGIDADSEVKALIHVINIYSGTYKKLFLLEMDSDSKIQCCDFLVRGNRYFFTFVLKNNHITDYLLEKIMSNGTSNLIAAKNKETIGCPDFLSFIPRLRMAEKFGMAQKIADWIYK